MGTYKHVQFQNTAKLESAAITTWFPPLSTTVRFDEVPDGLVNIHDLSVVHSFMEGKSIKPKDLSYDGHFWETRIHKEHILHHLKTMSWTGFKGLKFELGLAQFILLNAVVLETMSIKWGRNDHKEPGLVHALEKMLQLKRASSSAEVKFSGLK
ncbi:hypothetical protein IFM89_015747 [Coptis chinensis]|uniref:FBD domain-containing protein n=1 Tax=Coptis chinensis TaxID=261450 RepID=A0A835I181_9MAGN|nr:hypothetical protein IFM89_015747 [Coptis chinensis]